MSGKIYIGECDKAAVIAAYLSANGLKKVAVVGDPLELPAGVTENRVSYQDSIMYKYFYKMLQFVGTDTLFVWNDAYVSRNRYMLNYNCIRRYAQQTPHRLIFQRLPIREKAEDFMTLWDMIQPNPFLKEAYADIDHFTDVDFSGFALPEITVEQVEVTPDQVAKYQAVKAAAIEAVKKDPAIIPRRCLKFAETLACRVKGRVYDSKAEIKPVMLVSLTPLPVDKYFLEKLKNTQKEIENVIQKIHRGA